MPSTPEKRDHQQRKSPTDATWQGDGGVVDRRLGIDRRALAELAKAARAGTVGDDWEAPNQSQDINPASYGSDQDGDEGQDVGADTGLERRRGPGRRRTDFTKSAEEGEMTSEQFLFIAAIEAFKRGNNKMFPTWTDVLEVVRLLGYRKTMPSELNLRNVEDWREKPDTLSGVRTKPGHPEFRSGREAA